MLLNFSLSKRLYCLPTNNMQGFPSPQYPSGSGYAPIQSLCPMTYQTFAPMQQEFASMAQYPNFVEPLVPKTWHGGYVYQAPPTQYVTYNSPAQQQQQQQPQQQPQQPLMEPPPQWSTAPQQMWNPPPATNRNSNNPIENVVLQPVQQQQQVKQVNQTRQKKPKCKFGSSCYRNSAEHAEKYLHPKGWVPREKQENGLPRCEEWMHCEQQYVDSEHLKEFVHPTVCPYGEWCNNISKQHRNDYVHKRPCRYGAACKHFGIVKHMVEFSHVL
jgi:hypothetical protein